MRYCEHCFQQFSDSSFDEEKEFQEHERKCNGAALDRIRKLGGKKRVRNSLASSKAKKKG